MQIPEYKIGEDIKLKLAFIVNGQRVNPDLIPFDIKIWTLHPHRNKTAGYDGENWVNCLMREDYLEVNLNAPQFNTGRLNADITLHYPDDDMPDKVRDKIVKVRFDNPLVNPDTNDVVITGEISDTIAGLSAYGVAVWNGFEGTEEEWLLTLKQPALDAKAEAEALMEDFAVQELARVDEENTRKQSELARIAEEQNRVNQELARVDEENTRKQSELARIAEEQNRVNQELARVDEENTRKQSELARIVEEQNRSSNYVLEEQNRNSNYVSEEQQRNINYASAEAARNTLYNTAEAARNTLYNTAEGNRTILFNSAEALREGRIDDKITETNNVINEAQEVIDNPPRMNESTGKWQLYNKNTNQYEDTNYMAFGGVHYTTFDIDLATGQLQATRDTNLNNTTFSINAQGELLLQITR